MKRKDLVTPEGQAESERISSIFFSQEDERWDNMRVILLALAVDAPDVASEEYYGAGEGVARVYFAEGDERRAQVRDIVAQFMEDEARRRQGRQ